jgi:hypothetical protein
MSADIPISTRWEVGVRLFGGGSQRLERAENPAFLAGC